jgi:hypothetical protein
MEGPKAVNAKTAAKKKCCWSVRLAGKMLGDVLGRATTTSPGRRQLIPNSPLGARRSARQLRRQRAVRKLRRASGLRSWLVKSRIRFDYTYLYDDDGDRVEETVNGTATYYLINTNNPTGYDQPIEQKSSPTATPSETYIIGDRVLGQANSGGTLTYLLVDGQGSTRLLTNASGTVTATLNYDAFGNPLNFNPATIGTIWQFGGDGYYDYASGLTFHSNGRPSSSLIGRFIMMDGQIYEIKQDPITGNLYLLDDADPENGSDPSGHWDLTPAWDGTEVHNFLYQDFTNTIGEEDAVTNRSINTILDIDSGDPDASGRPDLVDTAEHSVFEIKSINSQAAGQADLDFYLITLNRLDPHHNIWTPGTATEYTPPSEYMLADGDIAEIYPPENGVITYRIEQNDDNEVYVVAAAGVVALAFAADAFASLLVDALIGVGIGLALA